jgi:hypothetical protein
MNLNYYHQTAQVDQHRQKLMREAQSYRISRLVRQTGLASRFLSNVGNWMISEGTRLKSRSLESASTQAQRKLLSPEYKGL